jgi:hypothetical protein
VLDARGRVHPFAKPLALRGEPAAQRVPCEAFGAPAGTAPLPVGLIAISTYRPRGRWRAVPLTPGRALLELIPHTVPVRRRPRGAIAALQAAVATARLVTVHRGEARDAAPRLLRQLERSLEGAA